MFVFYLRINDLSYSKNTEVKSWKIQKKSKWYGLAFMAFSTVWGFGNVFNWLYLLQWYPSSFLVGH